MFFPNIELISKLFQDALNTHGTPHLAIDYGGIKNDEAWNFQSIDWFMCNGQWHLQQLKLCGQMRRAIKLSKTGFGICDWTGNNLCKWTFSFDRLQKKGLNFYMRRVFETAMVLGIDFSLTTTGEQSPNSDLAR